jgi:hypothetical protein
MQIAPDVFDEWPFDLQTMLAWALTPASDETLLWLMAKGKSDGLRW